MYPAREQLLLVFAVVMMAGVQRSLTTFSQESEFEGLEANYLGKDYDQDLNDLLNEKMDLAFEVERLQQRRDDLYSENTHLQGHVERANQENLTSPWRPADCADLLMHGFTESGVYNIYPFSCGCGEPVSVYCDMETDNGGWTVILNREEQATQENFNRSWSEYKTGFGSPLAEHWLGNDIIHFLTASRAYSLRMDMTQTDGQKLVLAYDSFLMENENSRYRWTLGNRRSESTEQECYYYNNNRYFSTLDRDFDSSSKNCAREGGGGFWFNYCYITYPPTGIYDGYLNSTCYSIYSNYRKTYQLSNLQWKVRPSICDSVHKRIAISGNGCNGNCRSD